MTDYSVTVTFKVSVDLDEKFKDMLDVAILQELIRHVRTGIRLGVNDDSHRLYELKVEKVDKV